MTLVMRNKEKIALQNRKDSIINRSKHSTLNQTDIYTKTEAVLTNASVFV
jgi:hypothetical protein